MPSSAGFVPKRERFRKKIAESAPAQGFSLALFGGSRRRRAPQPPKRIFSRPFPVTPALGAGRAEASPRRRPASYDASLRRLRPERKSRKMNSGSLSRAARSRPRAEGCMFASRRSAYASPPLGCGLIVCGPGRKFCMNRSCSDRRAEAFAPLKAAPSIPSSTGFVPKKGRYSRSAKTE